MNLALRGVFHRRGPEIARHLQKRHRAGVVVNCDRRTVARRLVENALVNRYEQRVAPRLADASARPGSSTGDTQLDITTLVLR